MNGLTRDFLLEMAQNIGLFALASIVFLRLRAATRGRPPAVAGFLAGLLFGGFAVLGMMDPVTIADGLFVDGRAVMAAIAGFFAGPAGAVTTALITGGYRLWLGGAGAVPACVAIAAAALVGAALARGNLTHGYLTEGNLIEGGLIENGAAADGREPEGDEWGGPTLLLLAALVAAIPPLVFLLLPPDLASVMYREALLPLSLANFLGVLFVGTLLRRELQRHRLIDALAESQRRFAATVANLPCGVYQRVLTPDGRLSFPYTSPGFHRILGLRPGETDLASLATANSVVHPDDRAALMASIRASAATLEPATVDFRIIRGDDGAERWVRSSSRVHRRTDGGVMWDGLLLDITDRKTEERKLHTATTEAAAVGRLNARLAKAVEATATGIVITDPHRAGNPITFANQAAASIVGIGRDDLVGTSLDLANRPGLDPAASAALARAMNETAAARLEFRVPRPDGAAQWLDLTVTPVHGGDGHLEAFVFVFDDISAAKRNEQALIRARLEAEAAGRAKAEFLATMSHEIRTPLNGIMGFTQLLLDGPLGPEQRRQAMHVRDAGRSLTTVINDVLDFSRIEAGRLELHDVDFSIRELASSCEAVVRLDALAKGLSLGIEVAPQVPDLLRGDPDRLRQVVLNLLSNAVKFTENGGVALTVAQVTETPDGPRLIISVADTGIGIARDRQDRLFQRFSQIDRSRGGTGLGLAISRRLVELMGGEVGVRSRPGVGSTFWFTVTLPQAARTRARPQRDRTDRPAASRPARILLAEDLAMNRELAVTLLSAAGHRVDTVENGAQAVQAVESGGYDLVLMDVQMPVMDGYAATAAIRALPPPLGRIPILAMSASALPAEVARCRAVGMDGHVAKPVDRDALLDAIDRTVESATRGAEERTAQETEERTGGGGGSPQDDDADAAIPTSADTPVTRAAAAAVEPPVLDISVLDALGRDLGPARRAALQATFLDELPRRLDCLRTAGEDADRAVFAAHALAALAGNIGLAALAGACRELYVAVRNGRAAELPALIDRVLAAGAAGLAALRAASPAE